MNLVFRIVLLMVLPAGLLAQLGKPYRVVMPRADGTPIVFNMTTSVSKDKKVWIIRNAEERLRVDSIVRIGDSLYVEMPFFDSRLVLKAEKEGVMKGFWYKGTTGADAVMPIEATPDISWRFSPIKGKAAFDISGRFAVSFTRTDGTLRKSVAEFRQQGNRVTGTFLNPSGDYRYLEGIVTGDSLMLSCFDGSHAYYFGARIRSAKEIDLGRFCAGLTYVEPWVATKDPTANIVKDGAMMYLKEGEERLSFRFPDLDSNMVSISDERFRGKVVILQIMGSWCPNCMDETGFLSAWYRNNRQRGVEVIGLAYEYSTDFRKAERTLRKFQQRYQVEYPMLNTGVTSGDAQRTEKTLPQLTPIKVFPTTIFIGKDGRVKKIHPGFSGPGTGGHYQEYQREFEQIVSALLSEQAD